MNFQKRCDIWCEKLTFTG